MNKIPVIDLSECAYCETCMTLCPDVFHVNAQTGLMETAALDVYPQEEIETAISCCPKDCIHWEEAD
ncbi:MAG: ferredoxin [Deltaproteobacteria bacterium]|jgi:ferredoxin